jgi:hypothetical protein
MDKYEEELEDLQFEHRLKKWFEHYNELFKIVLKECSEGKEE